MTTTLTKLGGSSQLILRELSDLAALATFPDEFWAATSAPAKDFFTDAKLLEELDSDGDGRIQSSDVRNLANWCLEVFSEDISLTSGDDLLRSDFNAIGEVGKGLSQSFSFVCGSLGKEVSSTLSLEELRDEKSLHKQGGRNGDGILPLSSFPEGLRELASVILANSPSESDLSGELGLKLEHVRTFKEKVFQMESWNRSRPDLLHSHEEKSLESFKGIVPIIDAYFNESKRQFFCRDLQIKCPDFTAKEDLKELPLAAFNKRGVLELTAEVNPYYEQDLMNLNDFKNKFFGLKSKVLLEDDWARLRAVLEDFYNWQDSCPLQSLTSFSKEALAELMDDASYNKIEFLLQQDIDLGNFLKQRETLEKALVCKKYFLPFCNSFVSMPDLYKNNQKALFEAGTLILQGFRYHFCLDVADLSKHSKIAADAGIYLIYLKVTGRGLSEKIICVPLTSRKPGLFAIGTRGVFYDRNREQRDAEVVKIIENPTSLSQAFWSPFKRLGSSIGKLLDRLGNKSEKGFEEKLNSTSLNLEKGIAAKKDQFSPKELLLTGGMTFAALGSSFAYITKTFFPLNWLLVFHCLKIMGCVLLLFFIPVMIVAGRKLYKRDLSRLLEASGWSVNLRLRLTRDIATTFCPHSKLPKDFK